MAKTAYKKAKDKLDKVYSRFRRLKEADLNGNVRCVTCAKVMPWKKSQCGHYIPRNCLSTRWTIENTAVQCVGCNVWGEGKHHKFAIYLTRMYGAQILEKLDAEEKRDVKWSTRELLKTADQYAKAAEELEKEKGV